MKLLARVGCLARALVYFLIGALALLLAVGNPAGATTDESGVMRRILEEPFGRFVLLALTAGLFSYAIWRFFQSIQDHDKYGRSLNGLSVRSGLLISGAAHAFLGFYALNLIFSFTQQPALRERGVAKLILSQPMGRYLLFTVGILIALTGFIQFMRAFSGGFRRDLHVPARLLSICRFGLLARGIVFVIIGSFFMQAAWKYRSREAGGLAKAWETLRLGPYGNFVVGVVALGFMAFAIFGLVEGFYRKRTS